MPKGRTPPLWVYFCCTPAGGEDTVSRIGSCGGLMVLCRPPPQIRPGREGAGAKRAHRAAVNVPLLHAYRYGDHRSQRCLCLHVHLRCAGAVNGPERCGHSTGAAVSSAACRQESLPLPVPDLAAHDQTQHRAVAPTVLPRTHLMVAAIATGSSAMCLCLHGQCSALICSSWTDNRRRSRH